MKLKIEMDGGLEYDNEDMWYYIYSRGGKVVYNNNEYWITVETKILKEEVEGKEEDSYNWDEYEYDAKIIDVNNIYIHRDINVEYNGCDFYVDIEDLDKIIEEENLYNYEWFNK